MDLDDISTGTVSENIIMNQVDASLYGRVFNTRGYVENMQIKNNVLHNLYNVYAVNPSFDSSNPNKASNITFTNNTINFSSNGGSLVYAAYDPSTAWTFANNKYYTSKADGARFNVVSANKTDAQWISLTGDNSTFAQPTFPDSTRSIETYMQSLGETATIDAFIAKCRAQDRFNWDSRFTAERTNGWIKAGFLSTNLPSPINFILSTP
jgi:hypothetical protein